MITLPAKLADIELLVRNQVPESLHLDYKASPALSPEKSAAISKDVTAFANSDGGLLIYGVKEDEATHLPLKLDDGVDPKWDHERIEQIITSNISPRIDGIEIKQFGLANGNLVVCVQVPKSYRGPHQALDKKYYKRFNFISCPMEHYEVEDIRARRRTVQSLVTLDLEAPKGGLFELVLRNIGNAPAKDVTFNCSSNTKWETGNPPAQFVRGIKYLPPGKGIHFMYHGLFKLLENKDASHEFDIEVSYTHGESGQRLTESFHFDPVDFPGTLLKRSDVEEQGEKLDREIQNLTRGIEKLSGQLESLQSLTSATGLQLSLNTIKNLQHLMAGKADIEKISAKHCNCQVFQEVLGVDHSLAWKLEHHFSDNNGEKLDGIEGMTPELVEKFRQSFVE